MQLQSMVSMGGIFMLLYFLCVVAVTIFLIRLLWRFVVAHEKVAASLDSIARKLKDETKP